jgi:1,4-alpha-glucan branching enzyme
LSTARPSSAETPAGAEFVSEFDRDVALLLRAENRDPFRLLGPHVAESGDEKRLVARGYFPRASHAAVVLKDRGEAIPAARIREEGIFEAVLPLHPHLPIAPDSYRWRITEGGETREDYDTYAFPPLLSDFDLYLIGEGTHYQKYEKMGAHPVTVDGVAGVSFGVWAPNAMRVSVVGDFNQPNAAPRQFRRVGIVCARPERRCDLQVRNPPGAWRLSDAQKRSVRFSLRAATEHGLDCHASGPPSVE